ncbi:MAG: hypothetical protein RBU37_13910 [Myxococcota bacterium]|jgi:hypothetical protein|nr:hypothetical protein [Myxococcota bacterium]
MGKLLGFLGGLLLLLNLGCSDQATQVKGVSTQTNMQTSIAWGPHCKAFTTTYDEACKTPSECMSALCPSVKSKLLDFEKRGAANPAALEEECAVQLETLSLADQSCRVQP